MNIASYLRTTESMTVRTNKNNTEVVIYMPNGSIACGEMGEDGKPYIPLIIADDYFQKLVDTCVRYEKKCYEQREKLSKYLNELSDTQFDQKYGTCRVIGIVNMELYPSYGQYKFNNQGYKPITTFITYNVMAQKSLKGMEVYYDRINGTPDNYKHTGVLTTLSFDSYDSFINKAWELLGIKGKTAGLSGEQVKALINYDIDNDIPESNITVFNHELLLPNNNLIAEVKNKKAFNIAYGSVYRRK